MKKILIVLMALVMLSGCIVQSEGERVGTISKFSHKGLIVSTWEGDMILGSTGSSGNADNTWRFTVEDTRVAEKVKEYQRTGRSVVLKYRQEVFVASWRGDTDYMVYDVDFTK